MSRSVPEWRGKTPDAPVPPRVKLRIWEKAKGYCQNCQRKIMAGDEAEFDHITALVNGGENRENNLQLLCGWCHGDKTLEDVRAKSRAAKSKKKRLGLGKSKWRALPGTKRSGIRKRMDGTIERWDENEG